MTKVTEFFRKNGDMIGYAFATIGWITTWVFAQIHATDRANEVWCDTFNSVCEADDVATYEKKGLFSGTVNIDMTKLKEEYERNQAAAQEAAESEETTE